MTETNGNGHGSASRQISSVMTGLYRGLVLGLIGILGYLASLILNDIRGTARDTLGQLSGIADTLKQEQINRTALEGRINVNDSKDVDQDRRIGAVENSVTGLDRRLNWLNRSHPTP